MKPGRTIRIRSGGAATVAAVCVSLLGAKATFAQQQQQQTPETPPPVAAPPRLKPQTPTEAAIPETSAEAMVSAEDRALLIKAFDAVRKSKGLRVQSVLTMTMAGQGMTFAFAQKMSVQAILPLRFRSDSTMQGPNGAANGKVVVVGDGAKVWTYRPGLNQYAVVTMAAFDKGNDDLQSIGMLCGLVASMKQGKDDVTDLSALQKKGGAISVVEETLEGASCRVFTIAVPKAVATESIAMRLVIDPGAALIRRVEIKGNGSGMEFAMTEKIERQEAVESLAPATFRFTPPKGTKKVPKIAIGPF